jgi:hypothetical protein
MIAVGIILYKPMESGCMSSIDLTSSQKTILSALTDLYRKTENPIRGKDLAAEVNRNPGTVRNKMQNLKALQLAESTSGPKGGYKPTTTAYEVLDIERMDDPATVRLMHNNELIETVDIAEIDLSSVHHPELCRAEIHIQGSIRNFHEGDVIIAGPTPLSKLRITGTIDGKDETNSILILQVDDMLAPAEEPTHYGNHRQVMNSHVE